MRTRDTSLLLTARTGVALKMAVWLAAVASTIICLHFGEYHLCKTFILYRSRLHLQYFCDLIAVLLYLYFFFFDKVRPAISERKYFYSSYMR